MLVDISKRLPHLFEILDFESFSIHEHLDVSYGTGYIVDSLHHESVCVVIDAVHSKSHELWGEGDLGPFLIFGIIGDLPSARPFEGISPLVYPSSSYFG
jgi:hypothetical protein